MNNVVSGRDGGGSQGALGSHQCCPRCQRGAQQQRLPCLGGDGREVFVLWGGESCWTHLLAGQLILHLFSPDQPVSSNIIIN